MSPAIYSENKRTAIKNQLLENGFILIKKHGLKKASIEEVSLSVGIAKGTFYNFFSSKEEFVAEIISHRNMQLKEKILAFYNEKSLCTREDVFEFIAFLLSNENDNLYTYLTFEEISSIIAKEPSFLAPDYLMQQTINSLLDLVPNRNVNANWKVLANYSRMISIIKNFNDTDSFYKDVLNRNINSIICLMVDEVLGR